MTSRTWAVALSLAWPAVGCARERATETPPRVAPRTVEDVTARDYVGPALRRARLLLPDAFGAQHPVQVEVADTDAARTRGLMWREHLADGAGMLFIFPDVEERAFWMQNTLISLDMLFLDEAWRVVGILEAVPPLNREPRSVGKPSRYVLEVPAGWVAKKGIRVGAVVRAEGL